MPAILPPQPGPQPHWLPLTTHLEIVAGDDQLAADGRALYWSSPSFPPLGGAVLKMVVGHSERNALPILPVTWAGTVPTNPPSPSTIHLDVPSASTVVLPGGQYDYLLTATLLSGDRVSVASGFLSVTTPSV